MTGVNGPFGAAANRERLTPGLRPGLTETAFQADEIARYAQITGGALRHPLAIRWWRPEHRETVAGRAGCLLGCDGG